MGLVHTCCLDTLVRFPAVTAAKFSAKSELRVNSVDFEVGKNDHIKSYRSLGYSHKVIDKFSCKHYKHSVSFCAGLTFMRF